MYDFRHRRATKYARILTEEQMNQYFGWVHGSKMPRRYVHLSGRDVDPAILKAHGYKVPEEEVGRQKSPKFCPRCRTKNSPLAQFCSKCGLALDLKAVMKLEETRAVADQIMEELIQDPEVLSLLTKKLAEKGLGEKLLKTVKGVDKA
jgi:ribosomal protein L40E